MPKPKSNAETSTMALRLEVFEHHIAKELEHAEETIKTLANQCIQRYSITTITKLFAHLKTEGVVFWSKCKTAGSIAWLWFLYVQQIFGVDSPVREKDLLHQLWQNILTKLSLNPWLVCVMDAIDQPSCACAQRSHGRELLLLCVDTVKETIFCFVPLPTCLTHDYPSDFAEVRPQSSRRYELSSSSTESMNDHDRHQPTLSITSAASTKPSMHITLRKPR